MFRAALMRFVDDQRVVSAQVAVALCFGEQDAVGHQLDITVSRQLVGKTHLVTDGMAQRCFEFLRDTCRHRARGNTSRLGMPDQTVYAALQFKADLGQLRGFTGTGFAADDDHLVFINRTPDLRAHRHHRQVVGVGRLRQVTQALCEVFGGAGLQGQNLSATEDTEFTEETPGFAVLCVLCALCGKALLLKQKGPAVAGPGIVRHAIKVGLSGSAYTVPSVLLQQEHARQSP